jgi:hypothetical protein
MPDIGTCERCKQRFSYALIHNGFNDSAYAYCNSCGCTAFFSAWSPVPDGVSISFHQCITSDIEPYLKSCDCGGHFRAGAAPRCPHCKHPLAAEVAAEYLEANAPGTAKGWQWQRNWIGLYSIIVEGRSVKAPWITQPGPL